MIPLGMKRNEALIAIASEASAVDAKYGPFASMHEAYGVLAEEVAELFEAIRMRQSDTQRAPSIEREAIDVAAVALRIVEQCRQTSR